MKLQFLTHHGKPASVFQVHLPPAAAYMQHKQPKISHKEKNGHPFHCKRIRHDMSLMSKGQRRKMNIKHSVHHCISKYSTPFMSIEHLTKWVSPHEQTKPTSNNCTLIEQEENAYSNLVAHLQRTACGIVKRHISASRGAHGSFMSYGHILSFTVHGNSAAAAAASDVAISDCILLMTG